MKIALAQMNSVNDIQLNYQQIEALVLDCNKKNEAEKPEIIFFPENSLFFRIDEGEKIQAIAMTDLIFEKLKRLSQKTKIYFHITTPISDMGRVWNASVLISPTEEPKIIYKKIHLFDIALEGQNPIREPDVFQHGDQSSTFEVGAVKFGSSICYDLRFSELYSEYAKQEVDVILVPAAFLVKTGQAHWEVLLRARAIESQAYVLAAAQAGVHNSTTSMQHRETYGHTMAIDPWGRVIQILPSDTGLLVVDINLKACQDVRRQIPMKSHRRL